MRGQAAGRVQVQAGTHKLSQEDGGGPTIRAGPSELNCRGLVNVKGKNIRVHVKETCCYTLLLFDNLTVVKICCFEIGQISLNHPVFVEKHVLPCPKPLSCLLRQTAKKLFWSFWFQIKLLWKTKECG